MWSSRPPRSWWSFLTTTNSGGRSSGLAKQIPLSKILVSSHAMQFTFLSIEAWTGLKDAGGRAL